MNKNFSMIDGLPLHKHLKNGSHEDEMVLIDHDYGKFAEVLGKKMVNYASRNGGFSDIFPGICILSTHKIMSKRRTRHGPEIGDIAFELSYKEGDKYGKKIIIFEIKYGVSRIKRSQIRKYCDMTDKPGEYFPKADEVKVIYIFFNKIDTVSGFTSYQICELSKELANKVLQSEGQKEIKDIDIFLYNE